VIVPAPAIDLEGVSRAHASGASRFVLTIERLRVARGEAVALTGPSGSGKSTTLDLLALALPPDAAVRFVLRPRDGAAIDIAAAWTASALDRLTALRAAHIGYVLQQGGLLPFLTLRQSIALAQRLAGREDPAHGAQLAARLGIADLMDRKPATLSVGQRQRAAIARALAHRPEILLADEPTAAVHPSLADEILALLAAQARDADAALVLATHDPDRAARHGLAIVAARLAEDGSAGSRFVHPAAAP